MKLRRSPGSSSCWTSKGLSSRLRRWGVRKEWHCLKAETETKYCGRQLSLLAKIMRYHPSMIFRPRRLPMLQCMPGTLSRQLVVYRQRLAAAPVLLACETLSRPHVAQVMQALKVKARERLFSPYATLWTFLLQVLSPDGS